MKSTGIVRKLDELGRVVIPMEVRRTLDINAGTPIEIFMNGEEIVMRKYQPGCVLTGEVGCEMVIVNGKQISRSAAEEIAKAVEGQYVQA